MDNIKMDLTGIWYKILSQTYEQGNSISCTIQCDRLCGLVVRVPGYRSRGPGFDSRRYEIFGEVVGLERGPLSLVRINEELLERTVTAPV
jgi:hypothetical protein